MPTHKGAVVREWAPCPMSPFSNPCVVSRWKAAKHFVSGQTLVRGLKTDEANPWSLRGAGCARCYQGSRDGDVPIACSVSASEFHSWFGPAKYKSPFQTRTKADEVSEARDLPGCVCGLGKGSPGDGGGG